MCMRFAYTSVFPSAYSMLYFDWDFPEQGIPQFVEKGTTYGPEIYDKVLEHGFTYLIRPERIHIGKIEESYFVESKKHQEWMRKWEEEDLVNLATGPMATVPIDLLMYGRGIEGFLDLALYPEKMKAVNSAMTQGIIAINQFTSKRVKRREYFYRVCVQNFNGSLVSPKMFEDLCWPWMKQIIEALLSDGCSIIVHLDGNWKPFYHFFQDFPPKRIIMELEYTDMKEAKRILGNTLCLKGNVSCQDLAFGTEDDVRDICKRLIDDCASGGGFILSSGCEAPYNAKLQNIQVMIDTAKTYGKY